MKLPCVKEDFYDVVKGLQDANNVFGYFQVCFIWIQVPRFQISDDIDGLIDPQLELQQGRASF